MTDFTIEDSIIDLAAKKESTLFDFAKLNDYGESLDDGNNDTVTIAGVDEAGYGPWAGPVVACAVIINRDKFDIEEFAGITDSKKLSKAKRELLYKKIMENKDIIFDIGVGIVEANIIDNVNILQANYKAMKIAINNLKKRPSHILIDGIRKPKELSRQYSVQTIKGGDMLSYSIATASIIAKVSRDNIMTDLAKQYPEYGWEHNFGYGTKSHIIAIEKYGVTPHHRKSYKPIRKLLSVEKDAA